MRFFHHPDNIIYLENLQLPLDFFLTLEPNYSLPPGATHQEYKPGEYRRLFNSDSQWGMNTEWLEGDRYLSKVEEYKKAWNDYQKSLLPQPTNLITPNWQGLTHSLRGTPLFGKIYAASKSNWEVGTPFALLSATLNSSNPNLDDLRFALEDSKTTMGELLTSSDIEELNRVLANNHFPIALNTTITRRQTVTEANPIKIITEDYTISYSDYGLLFDTSLKAITVTFPTTDVTKKGKRLRLKNIGNPFNNLILRSIPPQLIDNNPEVILGTSMASVDAMNTALGWFLF